MKLVEEEKSFIERFLEKIGFEYTGVSQGKVYSISCENNANILSFVIPVIAEGILEEKLSIEVSYIVNGQIVKNPNSIELYKSLGLEKEIPYDINSLKRIIRSFKKVV